MTNPDARFVQTFYSGDPAEKLAAARNLFAGLASRLMAAPAFVDALEQLRHSGQALNSHMQAMDLGRLCTRCAASPGGGCCSAFMADNTDALQILINLLLGVTVEQQPDNGESCCFLGPQGCLFPVKPIFCLNYNCTHILASAEPESLQTLYQRAAAVLSRQTGIEALLLEELRCREKKGDGL